MNEPPIDSGIAERMVSGWRKSLNSSTSTQNTHSTPVSIARPKSDEQLRHHFGVAGLDELDARRQVLRSPAGL